MKRRDFTKLASMGVLAMQSFPAFTSTELLKNDITKSSKVPLGLCNHSLRGLRLNASQLIEYAIEQKLDSVLLNSFQPYENLEDGYLKTLNNLAKVNEISIYVGTGSISKYSTKFSDKYGNAEALLAEGIRIASTLGSPIVGCRIGTIEDRYTDGGIEVHIEEVIKVMKALRGPALDAGIKFAFENHAGDLRSEELLDLITTTGTDICGALFDPGNAVWALEDPMDALEVLGSHILCTSVRDVMVWETDEGATFQWTAIGEGLMDYQKYASHMAEFCPGVPLHVESISNSARPIPFLKPEFWKGFPDLPAAELVNFLKLLKLGHPLEIDKPTEGIDKRSFDIEHQQFELLKSLEYLRKNCNASLKN